MQLNFQKKRLRKLSLTPLIDVVFLLLVFFMLASTFSRFSSLSISGGTASSGQTAPGEIAFIRILEDGTLDLNGAPLKHEELASKLDVFADGGGKKAVLKLREGVKVQGVVKVLEKAKQSKIKSVIVVR